MKSVAIRRMSSLLTAAALLFGGCTDKTDGEFTPAGNIVKVDIAASVPAEGGTRVTIGSYDSSSDMFPLSWDGDETLAVVALADGDATYDASHKAPEATLKSVESGGRRASFSVTLPREEEGVVYDYYAVSPYKSLTAVSSNMFTIDFPETQTPTDTSVDPAALIIASQRASVSGGKLNLHFEETVAAFGKMTLKGIDASKLRSVKITSPDNDITGSYNYFCHKPANSFADSSNDHVVVDCRNLTPTDGAFTVWFATMPTTFSGKFTVTVTDGDGKVWEKECDASKKPIEFVEGWVTGFTVNMTPAEVPNTYVVLYKNGNTYYALSSEPSTKSSTRLERYTTDYNGVSDTYQTSQTSIVWTLIEAGNNVYYFENGGQYLSYSGSSNTAQMSSSKMAITVVKNGNTVKLYCNNNQRLLGYNTAEDYWAFYTTSTGVPTDLYLVPANRNTGGGDDGDDDNKGGGGGEGGTSGDVWRTGWPELPCEFDADGNGRDDNDNTIYYAHHLCDGGEKNAQNNGTARNYTVCFSSTHHSPLWVAAPRHAKYEGSSGRNDSYKADPKIPSNIQYSSKSTGGGCNKGHMLGSAERTCSVATNRQVFYYSNIAPQYSSSFNTGGGAWNVLEDWVDGKVCADTTYVVIGAYYDNYTDKRGYSASPKKIDFGGRTDVSCPTMFYYILLRTKSGNTGKSVRDCSANELICAAFVRAHATTFAKSTKVSSQDMMSVSDLEKITGFTYFANVPNAPKNTCSASDWGL